MAHDTKPFGLRLHSKDAQRMRALATKLGCTPAAAAQKCAVSGLDDLEGIAEHMSNPIIALCFRLASQMTQSPQDHAEFERILANVQEFKEKQADERAGQGFMTPIIRMGGSGAQT